MGSYLRKLRKLLRVEPIRFHRYIRSELPKNHGGVYRIFEKRNKNKSLYVGKTRGNNLSQRIGASWSGYHRLRIKLLKKYNGDTKMVRNFMENKCRFQFIVIDSANKRTLFEHFAIAILRPVYND